MWRHILFILPLLLSTSSIKVPVDYNEQNATEIIPVNKNQNTNVFYITDDANIDSYLVPPDPHKPIESSDAIVTPATYLIPPAQDAPTDFYVPAESDEQSDWLPIAQQRPEPLQRKPKALIFPRIPLENPRDGGDRIVFPIPSTHLEPPAVDAVSEYFSAPEEELPSEQNQHQIPIQYRLPPQPNSQNEHLTLQFNPIEPTLSLILTPPNPLLKTPTKLYPKKFAGGFKPVPIPIAQFAEDSLTEVPKAKPVIYFKPQPIEETGQIPLEPLDEKKLYHFQKAEHQRKLKEEEAAIQPQQLVDGATQETHGGSTSLEQETSETNFRYPGRNVYSAPLREEPGPVAPHDSGHPAPDGRTEFRMHGMKGPHSYQFGYDTGKGKNRQFRYEERDNDGLVRGHYGYMDRNGKLRVVNYSAHPEYGFHAEEPQEKAR